MNFSQYYVWKTTSLEWPPFSCSQIEKIENEQVVTFSNSSVFQWPPFIFDIRIFEKRHKYRVAIERLNKNNFCSKNTCFSNFLLFYLKMQLMDFFQCYMWKTTSLEWPPFSCSQIEKIENEQVVTFSNSSVFQWPPYIFNIRTFEKRIFHFKKRVSRICDNFKVYECTCD